MYDGDEDDDELALREEERIAKEGEERGKSERAFYDGLAKSEDDRHNAMRKDLQKRSILAGELRQKLRHQQKDIDAIAMSIRIENDRIGYEQKKAYRGGAEESTTDDAPLQATAIPTPPRESIGTEEALGVDTSREFSIALAEMHVKQLEIEKAELESALAAKLSLLHDEERALSQLEHAIARM